MTNDKNNSNDVPLSFSTKENNIGNKKGKLDMIEASSQSTNLTMEKYGVKFEVVKTLNAKGKNGFHVYLNGNQISKQLASMNKVQVYVEYKARGMVFDKVSEQYFQETGQKVNPCGENTPEFNAYWNLHKKEYGIED